MPSAKLTDLVSLAGAQVPTDLAYVVDVSAGIAGSKSSTLNDLFAIITRNITDGAVRFQGFAAPAASAVGAGAIYFDSTSNTLKLSENSGSYFDVGNVRGPSPPVVDNSIVRFDGVLAKTIQQSLITIDDTGALGLPDGVRQTFNPNATTPGLNVGSQAGDPSTPANGDLWYDSTGNLLRARINGATISIGSGDPGGVNTQVQFNNAGAFGGISGFTSDGTNVTAGDGNLRATSPLITTGIDDANGNTIIGLSPVALAVDQITVANATAGNSPTISTTGTSANINMTFSPKGTGVNIFTKNLLMNVGSGALDNLIFANSLSAGAVNASFGFMVAGVGSADSGDGPYFLGRGNTFTAVANQRGSMFFAAGGPAAPGNTEGSINFFTNDPEDQRVRIARAGSTLPAVAITQSNTGEIGLNVNNPNASTVAIATFSVNTVPFVVIDSSANSYFGNGITNAAPANYILNATGGSGTDIAGAHLDLAGGKGTGNAIPGQVAVRYPLIGATGTTLQSLSASRFPLSTSLYSNTSAGTAVANTTTETSLLTGATASAGSTLTIEAGSSRAGTTYRIRIIGTIGTTGTPTIQFRLKLGGTTVADTTAFNAPTNAAGIFVIDADIFVSIIGAGGQVTSSIDGRATVAVNGAGAATLFSGGFVATAIDFTANQTIDMTAQWGTANAANTIQLLRGSIERLR